MGLGKTLQSIALLYTLLRQVRLSLDGPLSCFSSLYTAHNRHKRLSSYIHTYTHARAQTQGFQKGKPIVKRCLIICPVRYTSRLRYLGVVGVAWSIICSDRTPIVLVSLVSNWNNELNKFVPNYFQTIAVTDPSKAQVYPVSSQHCV